jgi:alpha-tubulin suppressor-like RCC1 family protein
MHRKEQLRGAPMRSRRTVLAFVSLATLALTLVAASCATAAEPFGGASWGYNASGQLGDNSTAISRAPVAVQGLSGVTAVTAGGEYSMALLSNGKVMVWGNNHEGQFGNGTTTGSRVPVSPPLLSGVTAIAAGREHSLALLSNGTVLAWGSNEAGQLGTANKATKSALPAMVKGLTGVKAIAAGSEHSLALLSNGTVMSWGANTEGQLGDGRTTNTNAPVAIQGLSGVSAIAAGGEHSLALLSNGTVMSWGSNGNRQLGVPAVKKKTGGGGPEEEEEFEETEIEHSTRPVPVQALSGVSAISAGAVHSLALLGNGTVMAWGSNQNDQLGNGGGGGADNIPSPVIGLSGVAAIASAGTAQHNLALLSSGTVVSWGYDADGQLGNGLNVNDPTPVMVSGLGQVAGIAAGGSHSLSFGAPAPSVTGLNPSSGPQPGGTSVTITGANFTGATAVRFGASAAASFTVESPTSITAVSPPGSGAVDVTVTTPVTSSSPVAADTFTYLPPPTVTKVEANKGPAAGGTSVTITGANFGGSSAVDFGTRAAAFTVVSATSITAVSPASTTETVDVTVMTPSGSSPLSSKDRFNYEAPTIASVGPNAGPTAGGTTVTITGSGFGLGGGTVFEFGKAPGGSVDCSSTTTCVMTTGSAKKAGVVDVKANVGAAKSKKAAATDHFTYQ